MADYTDYPVGWEERVGAFAKAVKVDVDVISKALMTVIGEPSEDALAVLADESASPFEDIKSALASTGIPSGVLKKNIQLLRGAKAKAEPVAATSTSNFSLDVLPSLPDEDSFISALKAGGELKVGKTEVICAMKAAIANHLGLFDLPEIIKTKMEEFAEANEEPCGADFFTLRNLITKRNYADVLSVLHVDGSFVTVSRKNSFLDKLDNSLWNSLHDFNGRLTAWQQSWMQGGNPGMLAMAFAAAATPGMQLPPGLMAPPDAAMVRDAAEVFINKINKVFAGIGIVIARALAYEAHSIKEVLENSSLPASIGATNREQMLKMLGVDITADYVRLETNVTRFALAAMDLPKISAGSQETVYLGAMLQLGLSIQWDKLITTKSVDSKDEKSHKRY